MLQWKMSDSNIAAIDRLQTDLAAKQATVDALLKGYQTIAFPVVPGLTFDVLYRPAAILEQIGGDWYDIFMLPDGRVAFTVGDVCGRGLSSAVKMGQAKQAIKIAAALREHDPAPRIVLEQANRVIFLNGQNVEMATALYGVIDTSTRSVVYASAGHPPPVLARRGEDARIMPNHGFPLGVEIDFPVLAQHEIRYRSGDLLVLYTDGLVEFNHDIDEGESLLLRASREAVDLKIADPARFIVERVLQTPAKSPDDVAVLTIFFE
jgi:serine phosphatase RsbU (regulator of sigma subunit)